MAPHRPVGTAQRLILLDSVAIMMVIAGPVILATLAFAWWFKASNSRATYRPDWIFSGRLKLLVWPVPTLIITFLGGIAWSASHALDPCKPLKDNPLKIEVVSLDWKWLFIYPQQITATVNQTVVSIGTPLQFSLTSSGGDEQLFRAADRQPDLHNGGHGQSGEFAGR